MTTKLCLRYESVNTRTDSKIINVHFPFITQHPFPYVSKKEVIALKQIINVHFRLLLNIFFPTCQKRGCRPLARKHKITVGQIFVEKELVVHDNQIVFASLLVNTKTDGKL